MKAFIACLVIFLFSSNLFSNSLDGIVKKIFPKSSIVFGVEIIATEKVKDADLFKATNILEQC